MLTTEQIRNQTKTVTRRLGWKHLKVGDVLNACVKCMGLKPGEKIERICQIRVLATGFEPLSACNDLEAFYEGFPQMTGEQFIEFFSKEMKCERHHMINRIQFEYLPTEGTNNG